MTAATPKLPVFRSAFETWALIFRNLGFLLRVGWLWMLLAIVLLVGLEWGLARVGYRQFENSFGFADLGVMLANSLVQVGCLAAVAVQWHRHILQPHATDIAFSPRLVLVYGLAAFILDAGFNVLLTMPAMGTTTADLTATKVLGYIALVTLGGYLWGRVMLVLPAIALGHDRSVRASWSVTRANGWRLFFGSLLATIVPILMGALTSFAWSLLQPGTDPSGSVGMVSTAWDLADKFYSNLFIVFIALIVLSFLSIAYRELAFKRPTPSQTLGAMAAS
jgi:hypothetical protein